MNVNVANTSVFNIVRIQLVDTSVTVTLGLYVLLTVWAVKVSIHKRCTCIMVTVTKVVMCMQCCVKTSHCIFHIKI